MAHRGAGLNDIFDNDVTVMGKLKAKSIEGNGANITNISLTQLDPLTANKTFNNADKSISFTFTNPTNQPTYDGAFEIQASGAFSGDLLHVHQHTGNPGATDLCHLEAEDTDVLPLHITGANANSITADKKVEALTFKSTQATGTKPIDVTSTTVCTNLNADKIDGLDMPTVSGQSGKYLTNNGSTMNWGTISSGSAPTGSIVMWTTTTAPTGWLMCHGGAVSRTTYADLFAVIGETFGAGDGSTTFNLPKLCDTGNSSNGIFPTGCGLHNAVAKNIGATGGVFSHTHSATTSGASDHNHTLQGGLDAGTDIDAQTLGGTYAYVVGGNTSDSGAHDHTLTTDDVNNEPPYLALAFIIKT